MAETSTRKKPQSLNDSHYRFLQDLSAPRKPSSEPLDEDDESEQYRLDAKISGQTLQSKAPRSVDDDSAPSFSLMPDFDTPPEQKKPTKVKLEGRRRLCKLKSAGDEVGFGERVVLDDSISKVADFESPPPPTRDVNTTDRDGGGNEIKDILGELSARLEFLSIEKRKSTKISDTVKESFPMFKHENVCEEKKDNLPEYASAESSFSLNSGASGSSSDVTANVKSGTARVDHEYMKERNFDYGLDADISSRKGHRSLGRNFMSDHSFVSDVEEEKDNKQSVLKSDNFVGRVDETRKHMGYEKMEVPKVDKKLVTSRKPSAYEVLGRENEDEEDDCVIMSGKRFAKEFGRPGSKFKEIDVSVDNDILEDESSITLRGARYTYKLPGNIAKMLYPHQHDGLKWLWSLHCQGKGGILGDDMGLGKTMQISGFLAGLFHSRLIRRALIVAPKTLLSHWIKELTTVGLSDKIREFYGTCSKARQYELQYVLQDKGILLTTYDIVRANSKSLRGDNYFYDDESEDNITWDYMILDEGHLIKNPSTQRAKSLLEIPSAHRIIVSGTPIQNNLKELWALFNFCCPELLGDKQGFKERFEQAILRGNEKNASEREKRFGSEVAKELRECIRPYFLRRLKNEVFNEDANQGKTKLSKKTEMIVWLRLTSCQRQLYEAYLKSELVLSAFDGSPLAALTILKKICDHPLLLTKRAAEDVLEEMDPMLKPEDVTVAEKLAMYIADAERENFEENHVNISCKISFILSLLENLIPKGHNVLIFSQTRKMLNLIQDSLVSNGYEFLRIDGTTKASDRVKIVDDFQNGVGAPIFLLTSQVGGLGLTLTRADRVIVVDPAWNPSTDNQSVDRAYRIGQMKDVLVYRLMTCGTVEEKIYRKQIYKGGLFRTATEHKEQTRYFSQQDLRELFSLPAQGFDVSPTQLQLHEEHDCHHIMDDNLKAHIKFLESKGIAGVSNHSLLFSKAAPVQNVQGEDEGVRRSIGATIRGASASSSSVERSVDGSQFAFKPKDISMNKKISSPDSTSKLTESELKERINRLCKTLANKAMLSRLPDKGEKIKIQIAELNAELDRIKIESESEKEVIDFKSFSGDFNRVLNV